MLCCLFSSPWNCALLAGAVGLFIYLGFDYFRKYTLRQKMKKWDDRSYEKVILHGIPRAKTVPTFSPFVLKLETYLKAAKIDYEYDFVNPFGPKHKCPWISYKGVHMGDSQLAIEYLNKKFDVDFSGKYTPAQRGTARAIRLMVEEHLFWAVVTWIWIYGIKNMTKITAQFSELKVKLYGVFVGRTLRKTLWALALG